MEKTPSSGTSKWTKNQKIWLGIGIGVLATVIIGITVWQLWPSESKKKKGEACSESTECASTVCKDKKCLDPPTDKKTGEAQQPYTNVDKCIVLDIGGVPTYKMLSSAVDNSSSITIGLLADLGSDPITENRFRWPNGDKNSPFLWDGYTFPLDKSSPGGKYGKLNFVSCPIDTKLIK